MRAEVILYIYGAVCVSMIIFNIAYNIILSRSEPRMERRYNNLKARVYIQLRSVREENKISDSHLEYLRKKLPRVKNLIAFDRVLDELLENDPVIGEEYFRRIHSVVLYLAAVYQDMDNMQSSYFAYFLSKHASVKRMPFDSLQDLLLDYMKKDNLYCRFNTLKAMYHFSDADHIVKAIGIQDDGRIFIHEKLLTEGLLTFTGDHHELIEKLWDSFSSYSVHTRLAVMNYIRFKTGDYRREMFDIMNDGQQDKELRISAIRYFGKYIYAPALEPLMAFASDKDPDKWETANVAVSSLARYDDPRVIDILKDALHSRNWYVRYSAAQSLEAHAVTYSDLIDVVAGNDRFAREMMTYRLESRRLQRLG